MFVNKLIVLAFFASILIQNIAFAQIDIYGVNTILDGKTSNITITITFSELFKNFQFTIFGKVDKLTASSTAGPIDCSVEVREASLINCNFNLTSERRTIDINFETNDFIKSLNDRFIFSADFSINKPVKSFIGSIKLPEGAGLANENGTNIPIISPRDGIISSDGRRILVIWRYTNISSEMPIKFQVVYEPIKSQFLIPIEPIIIVSIILIAIAVAVYIRIIRRPEKLVLSVLDEFERKVMDILVASGGTVNQKKIVQETNLSKAKVSRVVKSLADRGLIEIERRGRTNKLKLVKKKLGL